jgi:hypothetical protein
MSLIWTAGILMLLTGAAMGAYAGVAMHVLLLQVNRGSPSEKLLTPLWPTTKTLDRIAARGGISDRDPRYRRVRLAIVLSQILVVTGTIINVIFFPVE